MKKLIPALCMLLVAAALLGTSTFAWFSMNSDVKATGMTVKATADATLAIKGASDTTFSSLGTSTISNTSMKPCTSYDGKTFAKLGTNVVVSDPGSSAATWSGTDNAFQATDLVTTAENTYIATTTYKLKSIGETKNVYVKGITISGTNALSPSLRVAITKANGTDVLVFNAGGGTNATEGVGKYASDTWSLSTVTYTTVNTSGSSLGSFTADQEYEITVKIWFEGQDTSCSSSNVGTANLGISIDFTTTAPAS